MRPQCVPRRRSSSSPSSTRRSCPRRPSRASGCSRACATAAAAADAWSPARPGSASRRCSPRGARSEAARRPVAWVTLDEGDDDAVVLWSHVVEALVPRLPGARPRGARRRWPRPRRCSRSCCRGSSTRSPSRATSRSCSTTSTGSPARPRARASRGSSTHLPRDVQLVLSTRTDPALPLGTLRAHGQLARAARRRPALHAAPRRTSSSTAGSASGSPPADVELLVARTEGWPAGHLPRRAVARRQPRTGTRWSRAFDGTSAHVVDFLATEVLAAHDAGAAGVHAAHRRCSSGSARRCATPCSDEPSGPPRRSTSLARTNLFLLPLDDRRRWFRFHHLFAQLLRVELERREPRARARSCTGARPRGTASRARPTRRSTTPSRRGAFAEAGALIAETWVHYANAGPHRVGAATGSRRFPAAVLDADPRLLLVEAWVVGAARARGRHARRRRRACARSAGSTTARCPTASPRSSRASSVLSATFGWGDVSAILDARRRARPSSRARTRRGGRWSRGRSAGRTTATATSTRPSAGWRRRRGSRRRRRPVDRRRRGAIADLLADRGHAAAAATSSCGSRDEAVELAARASGCSTRVEDGEVHTAHGVALAAQGRPEEALPGARAAACSCAGCGASRSTSPTA